jgi:hypothetical protein
MNTNQQQQQRTKPRTNWNAFKPWIWVFSIADFLVLAGLTFVVVWWIFGISMPFIFALLIFLSALHTFTWFIGYALCKDMTSKYYTFFFAFTYGLSAVLDIISVVIIVILIIVCGIDGASCSNITIFGFNIGDLYTADDSIYIWLMLIAVCAFIVIDIVMSSMGIAIYKKVVKKQIEMVRDIDDSSSILVQRSPQALYRARGIIRGLWMLEFFSLIGIIILIALGISVDPVFEYLTFAQFIHLILWIGIRAVAGSSDHLVGGLTTDAMQSISYIIIILLLTILTCLASGMVFVWRLILLITCGTGCSSAGAFDGTINMILSGLVVFFDLCLLVISIIYLIFVSAILDGKRKENNLLKHQKQS